MIVGKTDGFERRYMAKFKDFASTYGEFVHYERDRAARDIGLHFIEPTKSGAEKVTTSLCWFQMKGIMTQTLGCYDYEKKEKIVIDLKTKHLRFWYLQPNPTYLIVYIESKDIFLIQNIQKYIEDNFGKDIMVDNRDTIRVYISKKSILDDQAFKLIIRDGNIQEWKKAIDGDTDSIKICLSDYNLIWKIGKSEKKRNEHRIKYWDWQSKTRSQWYIQEKQKGNWVTLREHWQFMGFIEGLREIYPYLELFPISFDDEEMDFWNDEDEYDYQPEFELDDGTIVKGIDCSGEFFEFEFGVKLNEYGYQLLENVDLLSQIGLIEIDENYSDVVSLAPWHIRDV